MGGRQLTPSPTRASMTGIHNLYCVQGRTVHRLPIFAAPSAAHRRFTMKKRTLISLVLALGAGSGLAQKVVNIGYSGCPQ